MITRIVLWLWGSTWIKTIIRVKSWRPCWGRYGIEWPSLLVDTIIGQRETVALVWDWEWLRWRIMGRARKIDWEPM